MTSRKGKAHCDKCNKILPCQKPRIDVYLRIRGSLKIQEHYCIDCYVRG